MRSTDPFMNLASDKSPLFTIVYVYSYVSIPRNIYMSIPSTSQCRTIMYVSE